MPSNDGSNPAGFHMWNAFTRAFGLTGEATVFGVAAFAGSV
ncbi:MAG: hypothetical protein U0871_17810 [Gemmataceae bacterium]